MKGIHARLYVTVSRPSQVASGFSSVTLRDNYILPCGRACGGEQNIVFRGFGTIVPAQFRRKFAEGELTRTV